MNPFVRRVYEDPDLLKVDCAGRLVRLLRLTPEWYAMLKRLDAVGMLALAPRGEVPSTSDGEILAANFVTVAKDEQSDTQTSPAKAVVGLADTAPRMITRHRHCRAIHSKNLSTISRRTPAF